jgi:hypothetical protein
VLIATSVAARGLDVKDLVRRLLVSAGCQISLYGQPQSVVCTNTACGRLRCISQLDHTLAAGAGAHSPQHAAGPHRPALHAA